MVTAAGRLLVFWMWAGWAPYSSGNSLQLRLSYWAVLESKVLETHGRYTLHNHEFVQRLKRSKLAPIRPEIRVICISAGPSAPPGSGACVEALHMPFSIRTADTCTNKSPLQQCRCPGSGRHGALPLQSIQHANHGSVHGPDSLIMLSKGYGTLARYSFFRLRTGFPNAHKMSRDYSIRENTFWPPIFPITIKCKRLDN